MKINSLSCFLMGLGAGAAISMLFAPQSGGDTRRYLQSKVDDGQEFIDRGKSKVQDMLSRSKESVRRANGAINDAIDAGSAAVSSM